MPFTTEEIVQAGKTAIDFYLRNKPIDNVAVERPLLKKLMAGKKEAPGAKQFIVEQIRNQYASNFQWFNGAQVVTYNRRQTIEQAQYQWRSAHDGLALDEDRLAQNGVIVTDDLNSAKTADKAEMMQLTNLLEEQIEVLRLGFEEQFDQALHVDGTQSADAITGLDGLISLTPTTGVVGGIDRALAANTYWRNNVATGLTVTTTTGTILDVMETQFRQCTRNGGKPDFILVGGAFLDGFRNFMLKTYGRIDYRGVAFGGKVEAGTPTDMLYFQGVPMVWDPVFADLDARFAPATSWERRCYFINSNHIKLRPLQGHNMVTRTPPRAYDKYEYYWGLTFRGALTVNRSNAHAVLAIA